MYKFLASTWVRAPCDEVFAHYCDPANWQPALPGILALETPNEPPFGLGTRWRQIRRFLWMAQESEIEVMGFESPHAIEYRVVLAKLAAEGGTLRFAHTMAPEADGTLWTAGASLEMPERVPRFVEWTMRAPMRWGARRDLAAFRRRIECQRR